MSDILEELSAHRLRDALEAEKRRPFAELMRRIERMAPARDFAAAFSGGGVNIIAELKKASPSEGVIREDFRHVELAQALENAGAKALSVLCEPHRFLGSAAYLSEVRQAVDLPLLYKDFILSRYQIAEARATGADAVLLIAAILDDEALASLMAFAADVGLAALVETHDAREIERAAACGAKIIGVNSRNLRNFATDVSLLEELVAKIPAGRVRIAESGMHGADDIMRARRAGADGFLVGTALMRAKNPAMKLQELANTRG